MPPSQTPLDADSAVKWKNELVPAPDSSVTPFHYELITFPILLFSNRKMPNPPMLKGVGLIEAEILLGSIQATPGISITHQNLTTITSYNLLEKRKRTIIVPGILTVH